MTTHPMSPVDAAWFHMDGPANLAMVTGVMLTRERFDFDRVKAVYQQRILGFDRFRQRVVERGFPVSSPHWEDMPNFDIGQHIHHVALPAPHDQAALTTLLDDIASAPLDHEQPLWQVHVVDDVDGGSALIMRYHHCIGDGTAMMAVIEQLADDAPESPPATVAAEDPAAEEASGAGRVVPALDAIGRQAAKALALAGSAVDAVAHPQALIDKAALLLQGTEMLVAELLKRPDPRSPFKGDFGLRKRVAWSSPVALDDVKAIGAFAGAKVNDVLVAGMTGALRSYLRRRGVEVNETTVRAMVPVDLRPPHRVGKLGNEFGLVVLDLAVASPRRMDRLAKTKERMDALKRSPEAAAMLALFNVFGRAPKAVEDFATWIFGSKASVVMTNVVGPRTTLRLAGVPIERMMFWVPHPGRQLGMGISILSYRGTATLAVIADAHLLPDPEAITDQFNREFAAMLRQVRAAAAKTPAAKPAARKAAAKAAARKPAARPKAPRRPRSAAGR
ncbi:MAG: wax ester/triacylglycerol synthase family O-acyltransferase [Betaproteobacteria bacterium]|nr:wax ester/triacylglycerol synthase family O-acyltransferase [Betaproteobacteria bacterium]